jgi:hypothetical protein
MSRDILFLIQPGFTDPSRPGKTWYCPFCNQIEGVLATYPQVAEAIDVERLASPRPRQKVIERIGEEHQGLPVLIFADAARAPADAKSAQGYRFIEDTRRILEIIAERFNTPWPH